MKTLVGIICASILVLPVFAQDGPVKFATEDAPSLRILSVPIKLDSKKRKVTLSLEVQNTGDKTIKAFVWRYETQGVLQGYNVSITSDMPEVNVVLTPNETKKVLLVNDSQIRESIWNMPVRKIAIVGITFEDGSSWKRNKEPAPIETATEQFVAGERGMALFSTGLVRRGLCATARAT